MLGQRRRRWANVKPALFQRLVFAGYLSVVLHYVSVGLIMEIFAVFFSHYSDNENNIGIVIYVRRFISLLKTM